jgi:hypothetical protein
MRLSLALPLLVVLSFYPLTSPAAAPSVTLDAPAKVSAGSLIFFNGRVKPGRRTTVVVERRVQGHWVRAEIGRSTRDGSFRVPVTSVAGRAAYRIVSPDTGTFSGTVVVTGSHSVAGVSMPVDSAP